MFKTQRSMDNLRACKPTMMDYSIGKGSHSHPHGGDKVATDPKGDKKMSKEKRDAGETNYTIDPVTGQASSSKAISKKEADAFKVNQKAKKLKEKQINDDPGSKYDPSKDKVATDGYRASTAGSRIKKAASTIKKVVGTALFGGRKPDGTKKRIGE